MDDVADHDVMIVLSPVARFPHAFLLDNGYHINPEMKKIAHNCLGLNTHMNHFCNKVFGAVQQSGESKILVAKHVIMFINVPFQNCLSMWVPFDDQGTTTACLLRWNLPSRLCQVHVRFPPTHEFL